MKPKFRAWTEEGKVMYYDIYPFKDDTLLLSYDEIAFDEVPAIDFILMQSTGLFDKNGREIFEGDVVELHRFTKNYHKNGGLYEGEETLVGTVIYGYTVDDIKYFGKVYPPSWLFKNRYRELDFSDFSGIHEESFKVIGNIYQNPELIEKVEE